jgi:hypothetical protein
MICSGLVSSTAEHYADCRFHVSLVRYRLELAATAKHYATCHLHVSLIGYRSHLTEKVSLC